MASKISGHAGVGPGAHFSGPIWIKTSLTDGSPHLTGLTPYTFGRDDLISALSTSLMNVCGGANTVTKYIAPFAGSVVAITGQADQDVAASSSVTVAAQIAGSRKTGTLSQTMAAASSSVSGSTTNLTSFTFAAGATIEAVVDTNTTDPEVDLMVTIWTV